MSLEVITKAPVDVLDYDFDFSRWLPAGDRIIGATTSIATGTAATVDHIDVGDTTARVWLAGGADGDSSTLTVTITTVGGRTKEVSASLRIRECA